MLAAALVMHTRSPPGFGGLGGLVTIQRSCDGKRLVHMPRLSIWCIHFDISQAFHPRRFDSSFHGPFPPTGGCDGSENLSPRPFRNRKPKGAYKGLGYSCRYTWISTSYYQAFCCSSPFVAKRSSCGLLDSPGPFPRTMLSTWPLRLL